MHHCPYSGCESKIFWDKFNLWSHIWTHVSSSLNIKTNERPYTCPECDKAFMTAAHLKYHLDSHAGTKPYACDYPQCSKKYTWNCWLREHQWKHVRLLLIFRKERLHFYVTMRSAIDVSMIWMSIGFIIQRSIRSRTQTNFQALREKVMNIRMMRCKNSLTLSIIRIVILTMKMDNISVFQLMNDS